MALASLDESTPKEQLVSVVDHIADLLSTQVLVMSPIHALDHKILTEIKLRVVETGIAHEQMVEDITPLFNHGHSGT